MKIKYKLAITFTALIFIITIPLTIILPSRQEAELRNLVHSHGNLYSRLLSRLTLNILMANAADISASKVDANELLAMFDFLAHTGLVYADCVLISNNPDLNGMVISRRSFGSNAERNVPQIERLSITELEIIQKEKITKTTFPSLDDNVFIFSSVAKISGKENVCAARLFFSEAVFLEPVRKLRAISYAFIAGAIFIAAWAAFLFSRFISGPVEKLTEELREAENEGDYKPLRVRGNDEIGQLANTFNHMLKMLELHMQSLMESNRELRRIDKLKNEFLANISLELKTPLNAIVGLADALLAGSGEPLNETAKKNLSMIVASAGRLFTVVNAMLDFSRLKNKDITLEYSAIDIHSAAEAVLASLRPHIEKKGIIAVNSIAPGTYIAEADEGHLNRIFINIITNAVKFTESGRIDISAEETPEGMIRISIKDTGVGIPEERLQSIFEPFEQTNSLSAHYATGAGLGLPITKKLVELHGGSIDVRSSVGVGTQFSFTLRKAASDTPSSTSPLFLPEETPISFELPDTAASLDTASEGNVILAVDDEPLNLQTLTAFLSPLGYNIITAKSGSEALDILQRNASIALVILDVMMPRLSGYDVARMIRQTHQAHELPIIMLTAQGYPEDIVAGFEAGANDYLAKPVNRPELLARVKSLISLRDSAREHSELSILRHDVSIAHAIQNSLLPLSFPTTEGIRLSVRYLPMTDLGGDLYDFRLLPDGSCDVLIADASGHGIPAALISTMTSISYRLSGMGAGALCEKMSHINSVMCGYEHGQFITACLINISTDRRQLTYSNAGHWPFLIIHRNNLAIESFRDEGVPLGWLPDAEYTERSVPLHAGDRIILFTDGLVECRNDSGTIFGIDRFKDAAMRLVNLPLEHCADSLIEEAKKWSGKTEAFRDDVTLIIIDIA